jgi:hypothetical protein
MDWIAIAAISEIAGTIAVVVSLIYVGVQIKQNTTVARSTARQSVTELMVEAGSNMVQDSTLAAALLKNMKGEHLDDVERLRLLGHANISMRNFENIHYQFRTGMLTEEEWLGFKMNLGAVFEWPLIRTYWENEKQFFSPVFQAEIDSILESAPQNPDFHSHSYAFGKSV